MSLANVSVIHPGKTDKTESFSEEKLINSISNACYSIGFSEGLVVDIASRVVENVAKWLTDKEEVTNQDLHRKTGEYLEVLSPEAAYIYKNKDTII